MPTAGEAQRGSLERIRDLSRALTRAVDVDSLFAILHGEVGAALHADTFFLGLYDEVSRTIEVVRQADFEVELPGGTFPLGEGVTSDAIRSRQPRLIRHWSEEARPVQVQYLSSTPGLPESAVIAPVLSGDDVLGVIAVHKYAPDGFDENDLLVLEAIAAETAVALAGLRGSERLTLQLRARISELEAVLGTMSDAVLIVDAEGRLVTMNRAARELLCRDGASVVLGQPLQQQVWGQWSLGAREIAGALEPVLETLQRGEVTPETEVRIERGGRQILSFSGTPLLDAKDKVTGSVLIVRDVTGRHEIEELKDEMLSMASHDLKTPVTVIRSMAQLLRRSIRQDKATMPQINDGLGSIVDQTDRVSKLLTLLLDVSRIEAGRFEIYRAPVDLAALAFRVISEIQPTTDQHQIELRVEGDQPTGYWDESRLHQVLANLLMNAVKYSPNSDRIEVHIKSEETDVTVCVNDEGVGLTPEEAEHVFERFFRARSMRRLEGAGLGLYICHSVLAAHGGRIWVESSGPNRGSSFCFVLPRGESTN